MISEAERYDTSHPDLCHCLRWKGQFIDVAWDPTVPACNDGIYWCMFTQTCIGPDGQVAEPYACSNGTRACHGKGRV